MIKFIEEKNNFDYVLEKEKTFDYLSEEVIFNRDTLIEYLNNEGKLFLIKDHDKIIGYCLIGLYYDIKYYTILNINTIYIEKEYRNKNIGTTILFEIIKLLNLKKYLLLSEVAIDNISSQKMMEKLGLKKTILYKEFYIKSKLDAFIYKKFIK